MNRNALNVTYVTVVVCLAVLGGWLLLRPAGTGSQVGPTATTPAAGHAEQVPALENTLISLAAEVAALRRAQDHLTRRLGALEAAGPRAAPIGGQPTPAANGAKDAAAGVAALDTPLSEEEVMATTLVELDGRLDTEPEDPTWSQQAEREIATLFQADVMAGVHVLSAHCRSTLCRVEIGHERGDAPSGLVDQLPTEPPFDGEILVRHLGNDSLGPRTLVYIARPGYPLGAGTP